MIHRCKIVFLFELESRRVRWFAIARKQVARDISCQWNLRPDRKPVGASFHEAEILFYTSFGVPMKPLSDSRKGNRILRDWIVSIVVWRLEVGEKKTTKGDKTAGRIANKCTRNSHAEKKRKLSLQNLFHVHLYILASKCIPHRIFYGSFVKI